MIVAIVRDGLEHRNDDDNDHYHDNNNDHDNDNDHDNGCVLYLNFHTRIINMRKLLSAILLASAPGFLFALDVSVVDCGAVADGKTVNTAAIQQAIDKVNAGGGGKVVIPKGQFVTGTLYLKSNVRLSLQGDAELLGSRSLADYPKNNPGSGEVVGSMKSPVGEVLTASEFIQALIVADQAAHVGIEGPGTIDGRGQPDAFPCRIPGQKELGSRPMLMRFFKCRDITIENANLKNPASWGVHLIDCDNVHIRGVIIRHRANGNNDGIDIDGCRNVFISECDISSGDDAICPKSSHGRPCENIFVRNCVISSDCSAIKLGTSSRAGFRNIVISDCVMRNTKMGCIKLLCVDGGILENVLIQNIVMDQVDGPLFIRLGDRGAAYQTPEKDGAPVPVGILRNITISNIRATIAGTKKTHSGIMISGIPGHKISGIRLDNIDIRFPGMGPAGERKPVPEDEKKYPEQFFFGVLPSYGMYIRHAEELELSRIRFSYTGEEKRPAFVLEDVNGFALKDSKIQVDGNAVLEATAVTETTISGCQIAGAPGCLVEADAGSQDKISLDGNKMPKETKPMKLKTGN